jgi:hypothetical protein
MTRSVNPAESRALPAIRDECTAGAVMNLRLCSGAQTRTENDMQRTLKPKKLRISRIAVRPHTDCRPIAASHEDAITEPAAVAQAIN